MGPTAQEHIEYEGFVWREGGAPVIQHLWLRVPTTATMGFVSLLVLMVAIAAVVLLMVLGVLGAAALFGIILGRNLTAG